METAAQSPVIFLHIPKTAGMTLYQIMSRQYEADAIFTIGGLSELGKFKQLEMDERSTFKLIRGHMEFGLHEFLPGPSRYFTILRNPIDRVISYYYFLHQRPLDRMHKLIKNEKLSLPQFLDRKADPLADNAQTRLLSGNWYGVAVGHCTEDMLEQAKENLRTRFSVVGLTERFDETLLLLQQAFGWRNLHYIRHNVTNKRPQKRDVSDEVLTAVSQANQLDIQLYQYAQTLFAEQIASYGEAAFSKKLKQFQTTNRQLAPLIRAYWAFRKVSVRAFVAKNWERITK
jgi:hypothetical protein